MRVVGVAGRLDAGNLEAYTAGDSPQKAPLHDMHRGGASVCAEQLDGVVACGSTSSFG